MYADIIVDITHEKLDKVFQYRIPSHLEGMLKVGMEVVVPFGMGNKEIKGYVTGFSERAEYAPEKMKEVLKIAEESVAIESKLVALAAWMKESYGGTMIQALKTVLPIKKKEKAKEKQKVRLLLPEAEGKEKLELYLHKNQKARARLLAALLDQPEQDYDFLIKHFYTVHSSTTARREEMDAAVLTGMDLSMKKDPSVPQILIYHTHSQETYADYAAGNKKATVVELGNRLTALLEEKGYQVLHDTTSYDMAAGKLDRNHAYNYALDGIMGILQKYPSIQVVLDLHRDGVKESLHMVRTVNGKATAPIMFFNGMSQRPEGEIEYLKNPYKTENLAFSLQMQLLAEEEYPDLTRKIFLKGLRYNLHVRPRSALIEVGAQTNTLEEALNAMEPLADLLDQVLGGG